MLILKNIKKTIKDKIIVDEVSFNVPLGTISGLLGPNGAGKTTTFYIIAGLLNQDNGEIILDGQDISKLSMHQRSKLGIKYLPQNPQSFKIYLSMRIYLVLQKFLYQKKRILISLLKNQ